MSGEPATLGGQARALTLVREFMERPEQDQRLRSLRVPVLVFSGSRGAGKTALLASLAHRLDQRVPYARVDFETTDSAASHEVLSAIAIDLNRHCGTYGRLSFPRFVVGRIVMAQELDLTDHDRVRAQVEQALEEHGKIPKLREFLRSLAQDLLSVLPVPVPGAVTVSRYGPDVLLDGLISWRPGRRVVLGKGQSWYGHQDRGLSRDSLDVLVELNRRARRLDVGDNRMEVDALLLAAFLADLRDAFGRGLRAGRRSLNCVILLDNADTSLGQGFLSELVRARRLHAAYAPDDPDPVTVVATSRGGLASRAASPGEQIPSVERASFDDYGRRNAAQPGRRWYPVALRHLAEDEVGNMVAALGLHGGSDRRIAAAVYRLTCGHPGSTRLLLDAIAEQPDSPIDLRSVLDQAEPGGTGSLSVRERVVAGFLQGFPKEEEAAAIGDLVTCAAARDLEEASSLAAHSGLLTDSRAQLLAVFKPELWVNGDGAGPPIMQPVLRRLLLSQLAIRGDEEPASWSRVHRWLCERAAQEEDEASALHHTLAQGDVELVARRLASHLTSMDAAAWLRLVRFVVSAPSPCGASLAPMELVQALTAWTDPRELPTAPVARLTAALWIDADPLTGPGRRGLHHNVMDAYFRIAPFSLNGLDVLQAEAERHREQADLWQ
jgi:hypothetical protein